MHAEAGSVVAYAFEMNVFTYSSKGKKTPGIPKLLGARGGTKLGVALWYPGRYNPVREGFSTATQQPMIGGVFNLVSEFFPD